ncbi:hypothetical protein [Halothece sp. PCC 7418]|uniref:hypothetical protein n=1 Tax=Halothece sp. (strain PCC 7418) TaxID=65093 RepID=UPI000314753E|nr:hypothetical protein [Halothece sp. PCC 7418]
MYNNNHHDDSRYNHNGSRPSMQWPFRDENDPDLADNFSEKKSSQPLTQQGKENLRLLQRFYISLIVTGIVVGGILTLGVALLLDKWGVLDSPNDRYRENYEQKDIILEGINRQFNSKFFSKSSDSN